jgi:hypothetical protein
MGWFDLKLKAGSAGCCARAASGHAAALPSPAMNSLRSINISPALD